MGFCIDPVEVFEHEQQWLRLALAKQETFTSVQRSLALLRRIESLPLLVLDRKIEQGEKAGSIGFRDSSRVNSLPVIFSRISR